MKPTTRDEFKDYILRNLGEGVIDINISLEQLDDRVDEALEYFRQFDYDATEVYYFKHQVTQDDVDNGWIPVDESIYGITYVFPINVNLFSNNMFSYNYQFALNDLPSLTGGSLQFYVTSMEYLATIEKLLIGQKPVRFNRHTSKLYLDMKWDTDIQVGQYIVVECYKVLDEDEYPAIWSDRMFQRYATILVKRQWARNLGKYAGVQLPGGITMNGLQMYEEAEQERKDLEEEFESTFSQPALPWVG